MSTEIQFEPVACPGCDSMLLPERLDDIPVLCANCHTAFVPAGRRTIQRMSRRAVASLVLGLLSILGLFLTGIPAICLGALAIRDIQRSPRALRGKTLAVGGIVSGTVFGLICGACVGIGGASFWMFRPSMSEDPTEVAAVAARTAAFEPPRGADPLRSMEMKMGMRWIVYGRDPRPDHPLVILIQYPQGTLRHQVEAQLQDAIRSENRRQESLLETVETQQLEFMIGGEAVPVTRTLRRDLESGDRFYEYVAQIPLPHTLTLAALITPQEVPSGTDGVALSEDEVRAFFESFQAAGE